MSVESTAYSAMSGSAPLIAVVPAARIKPPGNWQNLARPYIVHFPVSMEPTRTHDGGLESLRHWDYYQVSIFTEGANAHSEAVTIRELVITALDGLHSGVQFMLRNMGVGPRSEEIPEVLHYIVEFEAWE